MTATGHAHGVGDGANAHGWAAALQAICDDVGHQLELRVRHTLDEHSAALMRTLGIHVVVDANAPPCARSRCPDCAMLDAAQGRPRRRRRPAVA